jgi:hypothetical protein
MDSIIARLAELTLANLATASPPVASILAVEQALDQLTLNDINLQPPSPPSSTPDGSPTASVSDDLKRLCLLDERFDSHMKSIITSLDALLSPDPLSQRQVEQGLVEEKHWLQTSIQELYGLEHHHDADIWALAEAMRDRLAQFASGIDMYLEVLQERSPLQRSPHVVNSGDICLLLFCPKIS